MDIDFVWSTSTNMVLSDVVESKIREGIESDPGIRPCHSGKTTVHLCSTGPLDETIDGKLVCQCGNTFRTFSCSCDGPTLKFSRQAHPSHEDSSSYDS